MVANESVLRREGSLLDPQPLITTDAARREWAAFYGAIARGYDAEYELGLETARVEDDVREASPAALERLRALAEQAERCAPKNFDIERQARRNLSPAEEERWSAASRPDTRASPTHARRPERLH